MLKRLLLTSFLIFGSMLVMYPTKEENTKTFDYCYSLEKILSRNAIEGRENISIKFKSISNDFARLGIRKSKGALIKKIIDQYKTSKNSFIINLLPNQVYCLAGYWIEKIKPGSFESIFYEKSKQSINELIDLKNEVDELINKFR